MAELLGAVTKATSSFLGLKQASIDNWGFKLFYRFTTTILIFSSILVTARQFFGEPIQCDAGSSADGVEGDVLNSYCWMYSTWNVPPKYKGSCSAGEDYGGITVEEWNEHRTSIVYNSYYQWVPLYLVFLAVLFYLPRLLWLMIEGGLMEFFGKGTTTRFIDDQEEKKETLVKFFLKNIHNKFNIYFFGFIGMEVLNVLIVLIQFAMTNTFLHYRFSGYGLDVAKYYQMPEEEQHEHKNPMCNTFPRIASCDYWRWGVGGQQENVNAICVLSLNMINDKVFLILWWWFFVISIIGVVRLIYRLIQTQSPWVRFQLINMRLNRYFKKSGKIAKIELFLGNAKLGDWFVLYQLSKNLNRPFFMDFLTHLSVRYANGNVCHDEDSDEESQLMDQMTQLIKPSSNGDAGLLGQMDHIIKPDDYDEGPNCKHDLDDQGDSFLEMVFKPKIKLDDVDSKDKKDKDNDEDEDDDEEEEEKNKENKSKKSDKSEERLDLPIGDDIDSVMSRRKVDENEAESTKSYKTQSTNGRSAGKKGRRT